MVRIRKIVILVFGFCAIGCRQDEPRSIRARLEDQMMNYEQKGFSGSVLIVHNGDMLLRNGYGFSDKQKQIRNTHETIFDFGL
jgi:CubicO group peptidase (beta-lactamase class C family)